MGGPSGAGACWNTIEDFHDDTFYDCGGSCFCYCFDMMDWSLGDNACHMYFAMSCTPNGEYCADEYEDCGPQFPCCGDLVCGGENYCVYPATPAPDSGLK